MKNLNIIRATRRLFGLVVVTGLIATQSGCSFFFGDDGLYPDKSSDYLKSEETSRINISSEMSQAAIDDAYVIPEIAESDDLGRVVETPRPAPLATGANDDMVRIQSLKGEHWVIIELQPGQVWPRLRDFLIRNSIYPEYADGVAGILETPWLLQSEETDNREKFRFTVVQGVQRGSSEVRVLQWQSPRDSVVSRSDWPSASNDTEREQWMLREFAGYVASDQGAESVSLLAQGIDTKGRIKLYRGDDARILVDLDQYRAWASTQKALTKASFKITDINQSSGNIFARYVEVVDEDDKPGFFARLFGASSEDELESDTVYRINVMPSKERKGWSEVRIAVESGSNILTEQQLENLLIDIRGHLS
ncbi:Outer membrane protein assembly factor BamC [Sinobacterium norvegicum]|uniref:Outer membrane protein assembly factor BamC n=1 Tax=Sinobacterium norvegicum TaxID=1641715 RepID=A0ABN8EDT9_9GAMM|nr:outer membrane protein assembly factor BamC [Sinobacterium norvegicum]CAH0990482.1 Outer membrane protein assembly factor BamC [Sinobacterium norvegicum]